MYIEFNSFSDLRAAASKMLKANNLLVSIHISTPTYCEISGVPVFGSITFNPIRADRWNEKRGHIVAYEWVANIDGEIFKSTRFTFPTDASFYLKLEA